MSSPAYGSMSGVMSGLPQGGVRPFQPSRGPDMSRFFTAVPYGGGMQGMRLQPNVSFGNRTRFGGPMMSNPFQGMGFGMGGQPQPQPPQESLQPAAMTPMTPTFAPQPQPARVMTEDERRMVLTTANPFSSGPDAINPMMGNRFNQARMEAGMGGIASLAPRQPTMNPFNRMGGLADLFRQLQMRSSFGSVQPPNPSQFMQPQPQPQPGPRRPNPFGFLGLAGIRGLGSNPFEATLQG